LLELIEEAGSLSRAAEQMRVSYRRAWLFMQQINQAFDEPAVSTPEHGHGGAAARLTDFGKELIQRYREIEARAEKESADALDWLISHHKEKDAD
jgi:molybdate transport system regulatory protein